MYDETLEQQDRLARIFTEIENQQPIRDQETLGKLNDDAAIEEHEP